MQGTWCIKMYSSYYHALARRVSKARRFCLTVRYFDMCLLMTPENLLASISMEGANKQTSFECEALIAATSLAWLKMVLGAFAIFGN